MLDAAGRQTNSSVTTVENFGTGSEPVRGPAPTRIRNDSERSNMLGAYPSSSVGTLAAVPSVSAGHASPRPQPSEPAMPAQFARPGPARVASAPDRSYVPTQTEREANTPRAHERQHERHEQMRQLFDCAESGDQHRLKNLAAQSTIDLYAQRDEDGYTPLMLAISHGNEPFALALISHGSAEQLMRYDHKGNTALDLALDGGMDIIARMLLNMLRHPRNACGYTPLVAAIADNREIRIWNLLKILTDVNQKSTDGTTALAMAIRREKPQLALRLLEKGACIDESDIEIDAPLAIAAQYSQIDIINALVARKASMGRQNRQGVSALAAAVGRKRLEAARCLLRHGADPDMMDKRGAAPLHTAAACGDTAMIALLLEHDAMVNLTDHQGHTSLHKAAFGGHAGAVAILLKAGGADDRVDKAGRTALEYAAQNRHEECSRLLLEHGAARRQADPLSLTPLELQEERAARNDRPEEAPSEVDAQRLTPLEVVDADDLENAGPGGLPSRRDAAAKCCSPCIIL